MGASISSLVKNFIDKSPFISEMLIEDLISFSNLARYMQEDISRSAGYEVSHSSLVMASRRYASELKEKAGKEKRENIGFEISMKTNIYDLNLRISDETASSLMKLYDVVQTSNGDFLNITIGSHEISLAISGSLRDKVDSLISEKDVIHRFSDLVAITIVFTGDFLQTPGILHLAARKLAWAGINIIEIVSTMNVLTFVIGKEQSSRAYEALTAFLTDEI